MNKYRKYTNYEVKIPAGVIKLTIDVHPGQLTDDDQGLIASLIMALEHKANQIDELH